MSAARWLVDEMQAELNSPQIGVGIMIEIPAIPAVKAQIRSLSLSTAKRLAAEALECASATEVRRTVDSLSLRTFSKAIDSEA